MIRINLPITLAFNQKRVLTLHVDFSVNSIFLDKLSPWWYFIAQEHGENTICFGSAVYGHFSQCSVFRIHRRIPQLVCIHLSKTFVTLYRYAAAHFFKKFIALFIAPSVHLFTPFLQ